MIAFNAIHAEVTWTLSDGGVLTISGTSMPSYDNHAPWYAQREKIKIVIIENGVTNIGSYAFMDCSSLNSVTIPNSVTSIGDHAFDGTKWYTNQPNGVVYAGSVLYKYKGFMPANTNIVIKDGTTGISAAAFMNCSALSSVVIPNSVTNIGVYAFAYCNALTSIIIPNSVTNIGQYAFYNCNELVSISMSNSVTSIGDHAFDGTKWYEKYNNLIYMGAVLYKYKGTAANLNINIKDGTKSITNYAFYDCTGLKSVQIPNSMIDIGFWAFYRCSALTSIIIPNSVTNIGNYAFYGCSNLTTISISNSVTSIGDGTFYGCSGVTSVVIPESVTNIGKEAFSDCFSLTSISTENTITSVGVNAFYGTKWYDNQPDGLVYVGSALYNYKGTMSINSNINIKEGTKSITDYAFAECSGLTSITIPSSVNNIGEFTFHNCELLSKLTCNALTPPSLGYAAFYGTQYESGTLYVPASAISAYKTTSGWKKWKNILPIEDTTNAPTNISFANESEKIIVGKTIKLETTITPENATNKTITWTSTNTDVATVSSEGIVTAKGAGTTIITATTNNGKTAKCTITVEQPVTAIALSDATTSLWVGKTKTLTATITPRTSSNTAVNWSSSDENVATVSSDGIVTANSEGTCIITCTAADGYGTKSICEVTVKQQVTEIALSETNASLWVGETKTITATALPTTASNTSVEWSSSDENIASVSSEGVITANGEGSCIITCTAADGYGTKSTCEVTIKQQVTEIALSETNASLWVGDTKTITATASPTTASNTSVEWSSSDDNVATVSSDGVITAKGEGTCIITCTAADGYGTKSICEVIVKQQVTEIALSETNASLWVDETKTITATALPTTASNTSVEWSSSDDNVATVSSDGVITAKGEGTCIITCTAADGYGIKSTCEITVKQQVTEIVLSETTVSLCLGDTKTITATATLETASNTDVIWSSSDENVATVSADGIVTAKGEGTCIITCTAADGYGTVSVCEVTVMQQATSLEDLRFANDKSPVYNLNGQRISKAHALKGVYIKNGKKYANKN